MEWFKKLYKCNFKNLHKVNVSTGVCIRCKKVCREYQPK